MLARRIEAIVILALSFALAAYVVGNRTSVDHMLHALGPFAIPAAVIIFAVVASAPFSVTDALAVSNGVLFGPWVGSAVNTAGIVLAAVIGYRVALRTSKLLDIEAQVRNLPAWVRRYKVGSPMFLIVVRIIPGMGGTIATQTAAALHVPLWRQIYTMAAIAVPVCTALAFGGDAISTYVETHFVVPAQHYAERHHMHLPHRRRPSPSPGPSSTLRP